MNAEYEVQAPIALVIEDQPYLAEIFSEALTAAGYRSTVTLDGMAAMEFLDEVVPDVVVLDLHLPYIPGKAILNHLRQDSRFVDTLVFLATADAAQADETKHDADLVLLKPISFNQLRDLSQRFMSRTATGLLNEAID